MILSVSYIPFLLHWKCTEKVLLPMTSSHNWNLFLQIVTLNDSCFNYRRTSLEVINKVVTLSCTLPFPFFLSVFWNSCLFKLRNWYYAKNAFRAQLWSLLAAKIFFMATWILCTKKLFLCILFGKSRNYIFSSDGILLNVFCLVIFSFTLSGFLFSVLMHCYFTHGAFIIHVPKYFMEYLKLYSKICY